jgi:hypothetical protein
MQTVPYNRWDKSAAFSVLYLGERITSVSRT